MYKYLLSDFHGTIVDSNAAWITAYKNLGAENIEDVTQRVFKKENRKLIAQDYSLDYDTVVVEYRKNLHIRMEVVDLMRSLPGFDNIIIVSNARKDKLLKDIKQVESELNLNICAVYGKEDGSKNDQSIFENILKKHNIEAAYMIGNDIREDFCKLDNIINIFMPYKNTLIFNDKL